MGSATRSHTSLSVYAASSHLQWRLGPTAVSRGASHVCILSGATCIAACRKALTGSKHRFGVHQAEQSRTNLHSRGASVHTV